MGAEPLLVAEAGTGDNLVLGTYGNLRMAVLCNRSQTLPLVEGSSRCPFLVRSADRSRIPFRPARNLYWKAKGNGTDDPQAACVRTGLSERIRAIDPVRMMLVTSFG